MRSLDCQGALDLSSSSALPEKIWGMAYIYTKYYANIYGYTYVFIFLCIYIYVYMYICIYVYMFMNFHTTPPRTPSWVKHVIQSSTLRIIMMDFV